MAIRVIEGFDHYNDATELQRKWSFTPQAGIAYTFSTTTRFGFGKSFGFYKTSLGATTLSVLQKSLPTNEDVVYEGFAFYNPQVANAYDIFLGFLDGTSHQILVKLDSSRNISVLRGGLAGTVIVTDPIIRAYSTWFHISAEFTIHDTLGTIKVWVNGELIINLTGQNTRATANNYANRVQFGAYSTQNGSDYVLFDDVYSGDDTGAINTSCPTESRVYTLYPTSSGTYQEWSYTGTTYAWQAVDGANPDDNTSYIYSSVSGTRATFTFSDLETDADNVYAVQFVDYGRKDDADVRATRFLMGLPSGTFYQYGTGSYMGSDYQFFTYIQETDPITAGALTPTIINNNEVGVIVSI